MPAEAIAPPPAPAPAAPSAPAAAPAAPEIHVTPAAVDRGPKPTPPKQGSAMDRMFKDLHKKAGIEPETTPAVTPKPSTPEETNEETSTETTAEATPPASTEAASPQAPVAGEKKGKVSPWKLLDEHKAARLKAETELAEIRKSMAPPEKLKEYEEKLAAVEKRAKELDDHIRYVDYSKSTEFKEKYDQPYEAAWKRWMGELGELKIADPGTGDERAMAPQDIMDMVFMPLQKAREHAENTFGAFADDVMDARKEIKTLLDSRNNALEQAKKMGAEHTAAQQKAMQEKFEGLRKEVTTVWEEANKQAISDEKFGHYFKPVEGDEEGNKRLAAGYQLADRAFALNSLDPNLTSEQRAEAVRVHAAVRNRAAAFGRLSYQNQSLQAKVKALEAELNKYKEVEPGSVGDRRTEAPVTAGGSAMERMKAELRKRATG